jgi:cytochrome c5
MKIKILILAAFMSVFTALCLAGPAGKSAAPASNPNGASIIREGEDPDTVRVEGEKRFRANCGRCHAAPHKFPPRMMATIVRHMRVRATITDEDMRLVLFYMTQ